MKPTEEVRSALVLSGESRLKIMNPIDQRSRSRYGNPAISMHRFQIDTGMGFVSGLRVNRVMNAIYGLVGQVTLTLNGW